MKRIAVVLALVGASGVVWAGFRRQSAAFCSPQYNTSWYEMTSNRGLISRGLGDQRFFCPVLDDSKFSRTTLTYVNVHVKDTNAGTGRNVTASACVKFFGSFGTACGTSSGTTTTGTANLTPSVTQWTAFPADFAFLDITVCPDCQVYGYFPGT